MEQQLRRYFFGIVGFAFVVTWATLGATDAVAAALVCLVGANLHQLLPRIESRPHRSQRIQRPARSRLSARPLRAEDVQRSHELVPDDPSLIIGT